MTSPADVTPPPMPLTILGDWGTSRLRLYLCEPGQADAPAIRAVSEGPGAKFTDDFEAALLDALRRLPAHAADTPVVLAGMVGSNIGWHETAYVPCPAAWHDIARHGLAFSAAGRRIVILPGVSCSARYGYTDVMRGEETQLVGLGTMLSAGGRRLACLPGTHTKWATLGGAGIERFATTVQGELYDLLRRSSILVPRRSREAKPSTELDLAVFTAAVDLVRDHAELALMQALFSVRCRVIAGMLSGMSAEAYLSGLLIGADVRDAGRVILAAEAIEPPVLLVGEPQLTNLYATALSRFGLGSERYSGEDCVVRGLASVAAGQTGVGA